jgi:cytochrome bd-type quinol oxidase subunit 1
MELKEIFLNSMMTCVIIYLMLVIGYSLAEECDRKLFLEKTLVRILASVSCYGFIASLIGWVWC